MQVQDRSSRSASWQVVYKVMKVIFSGTTMIGNALRTTSSGSVVVHTMKWTFITLLSCMICTVLGSDCFAQDAAQDDDKLREQVLSAIERGQRYLIDQQNNDGSWPAGLYETHANGVTGLVTLALLNSGLPSDHPAVAKALDHLEHPQMRPVSTYEIAMVIMALAASDRGRGKIAELSAQLESMQLENGSWDYGTKNGNWDNSNAQFAVLALREAAHVGIRIDEEVWRRAQKHFLNVQIGSRKNPSGAGWAYKAQGTPTGSMTVAGLASLIITQEMLQDDGDVAPNGEIQCCGGDDDSELQEGIDAGLQWLSRNLRIESNPGVANWKLYYLYGLERAGRFSGRRFFGDRDWYREGAEHLVNGQDVRAGFWISHTEPVRVAGTSLVLLFLSKGLSPVLINKLKYGPQANRNQDFKQQDWNKHPRDAKNLTNFISRQEKWPKLLSWQVVDLRTAADGEGVAALMQSPVQLLTGSNSLDSIQGRELELLRKYLAQGGFLFAVNNCDSDEFETGFRDLVRRLFAGQNQLTRLPDTHDVYRSEFLFEKGATPELWGVDFGCRTAIIYSPYDHACRWNKWAVNDPEKRLPVVKTQIDKSMKMGTNVIAYATGRELFNKLERPKILSAGDENQLNRGRLTIARLRHTGGWDTAPNALGRLQAALETVGIEAARQTPNLPGNDPALFDYPLIYMHGRKNFQLSDEEIAGLGKYLSNGGFLFADACCGAEQFDESFRKLITQMFGQPLEKIPVGHELYNMQLGYDIRRVKRRIPAEGPNVSSIETRESIGEPILEGIQVNGKYVVVYSKYDLSCALERQATTACAGYATEDAVKIGVNFVIYGLFQ